MAGKILIINGLVAKVNYQPHIYFVPDPNEDGSQPPTQFISWVTISAEDVLDPGTYTIPEDQRDNLDWFNDNNFRTVKFCRRHLTYCMQDNLPETVLVQ